MEESLPHIDGSVSQNLMELEAKDKETYDLWDKRRDQNLKKDHPKSLMVLQEVLEEAIAKKGWTIQPYDKFSEKETLIAINLQWGSVQGTPQSSEPLALLSAYLSALKGI